MTRVPYSKPATSYADQLHLLKSRGLKINDEPKILHLLQKLSYFRLSGYWYPFLQNPKNPHRFKDGSDFQAVFRLYRFDRDLRIFILKELEKIEVCIRAKMIYVLSHAHGAFWYTDASLFTDKVKHHNSLIKLKEQFRKSDEQFIKAFKATYSDPLPPSWMMLEISSFGTLSMLYENLKPGKSKRDIAHLFGLDDATLVSWLHCLGYIRNVCAHHCRLWNRGMSIRPRIPLTPSKQWLVNGAVRNDKTYFILSMMLYLLQEIDIKHQLIFRLKILLRKYKNVDVAAMGFPKNFEKEPLWQFRPAFMQRIRLLGVLRVK